MRECALGLCRLVRSAEIWYHFKVNFKKALTAVLVVIAWFWTAYECDTIGIDVFDMLLKRFPGQLWIMAAVLSYLTWIWMSEHLLTRAVMGIFMLIPAELFKVTRPMLPDGGFAPVQIVVAVAYVLAVIGMYGMFYPWKIERALGLVFRRRVEETPKA